MIMLTGDQETAARAVCERLGIDTFRAQVLPADKASLIEGYKEGGSRLIMVGDGVNDSPALAAADVSVAMREPPTWPGRWRILPSSPPICGSWPPCAASPSGCWSALTATTGRF